MKFSELQKRDKKELNRLLQELKQKLSDFRFKLASGKLKNVKEINQTKKDIARILTVLGVGTPKTKICQKEN